MPISNITAGTSILVMLSGNCCSPCYTFETTNRRHDRLSPGNLQDILLWATREQQQMRNLFFLVGDNQPLEPSVALVPHCVLRLLEWCTMIIDLPIARRYNSRWFITDHAPASFSSLVLIRDTMLSKMMILAGWSAAILEN